MPSTLPIPDLGLTLRDLVEVIQVCSSICPGRFERAGLRSKITARLQLSNPLLAFKLGHLSWEQMDALYDYIHKAQDAPG